MTGDTRVSERIKEIRAALNLTQKELSSRLKVSNSTLSDVEKGKYNPNFELIRGLVDVFKVNIYYLLFGEGEMFIEPGKDQFRQLEGLANRNEGIRKFLYYFEHSAIFRYKVMGNAEELLIDNFQSIDQEIKNYRDKNEKPTLQMVGSGGRNQETYRVRKDLKVKRRPGKVITGKLEKLGQCQMISSKKEK